MRRTQPLSRYIPGLGRAIKVRWRELAWDEEEPPQELKERLRLPITFGDPPSGFCRVVGLYVNPSTGQLIIQWDDTPIE